jgi:hypothetical protein
MDISHNGNTPTVECPDCGTVEVISLLIKTDGPNTNLFCQCGNWIDGIGGLRGTGIEECNLVRL